MGRRRKMSEREAKLREMAYKMAKELGFEGAMLLLYEEAMREERERYREKHPEDPSNGHHRRVVKIFGYIILPVVLPIRDRSTGTRKVSLLWN